MNRCEAPGRGEGAECGMSGGHAANMLFSAATSGLAFTHLPPHNPGARRSPGSSEPRSSREARWHVATPHLGMRSPSAHLSPARGRLQRSGYAPPRACWTHTPSRQHRRDPCVVCSVYV
jgi:hypothetical protein